jgi:hypothetical protein
MGAKIMYSPWGKVQNKECFGVGVYFVHTASHGGFMISQGKAKHILSKEAIALGELYNGYLCYEEDVKYSIVVLENSSLQSRFKSTKEELIQDLSRYYPEYLISRGMYPIEKEYAEYKEWTLMNYKREIKDPDLIVSAVNFSKGVVKVWTADNQEHYVTSESYSLLKGYLRNLSDCILVCKNCEDVF